MNRASTNSPLVRIEASQTCLVGCGEFVEFGSIVGCKYLEGCLSWCLRRPFSSKTRAPSRAKHACVNLPTQELVENPLRGMPTRSSSPPPSLLALSIHGRVPNTERTNSQKNTCQVQSTQQAQRAQRPEHVRSIVSAERMT